MRYCKLDIPVLPFEVNSGIVVSAKHMPKQLDTRDDIKAREKQNNTIAVKRLGDYYLLR